MSDTVIPFLDLDLAWRRARADSATRLFVRQPFIDELIRIDSAGWLRSLGEDLRLGRYNPSPAVICEVPKANSEVRPGSILSVSDRVVYAACVGACLPQIKQAFDSFGRIIDFAYRLPDRVGEPEWFRSRYKGWEEFRERSIASIDAGASYVVLADIAGFYENVDIGILMSDLKQLGAREEVVSLLSRCLNRWAQVAGRGLPQGHSPSDVLGKLYLYTVDHNLGALGLQHFRYVDDMRVLCTSRVEARRAIVELSRLLRDRGLNIQSAKLGVYRSDVARRRIESIAPIVKSVGKRFVASVMRATGVDDPYAEVWDAEKLLKLSPDDTPLEVIRETYRSYFVDAAPGRFNASLFRFLVNRLGRQADDFALEHSVSLLERRPEVMSTILQYWSDIRAVGRVEAAVVQFLNSPEAIYPYQIYQIIEWRGTADEPLSAGFAAIARTFAFDRSQPEFLRSVARSILARFGSAADLERVQRDYANTGSPVEQAEILCCLRRMESGRRNAFLARCAGDGELQRRAVVWVRAN